MRGKITILAIGVLAGALASVVFSGESPPKLTSKTVEPVIVVNDHQPLLIETVALNESDRTVQSLAELEYAFNAQGSDIPYEKPQEVAMLRPAPVLGFSEFRDHSIVMFGIVNKNNQLQGIKVKKPTDYSQIKNSIAYM